MADLRGLLTYADGEGDGLLSKAIKEKLPQTFWGGLLNSAISGATLPGDVYAGRASSGDIGRVLDTAGLVTLGAGAMPSQPNTLRMGMGFKSLADVEAYAKKLGVDTSMAENHKGQITIGKIVVPKDKRGNGIGSEVMKAVSDYADETGKQVILTPDTHFGGTSKKRLTEFYKRFGFVENKGRGRDLSISEEMFRDAVRKGNAT